MKRLFPIIIALIVVAGLGSFVILQKNKIKTTPALKIVIGGFVSKPTCNRLPLFLRRQNIPQPVTIDLSQKRFTGVALLYGKNFSHILHPKQWEQYEHFSTYTLDEHGNIYLVPTPFISIRPTTFNLQKKIYKLDSSTGKISIWMNIDDVRPNARNPYGVNAIAYDCDDHTLWVAAIDESDYQRQKGVIYHIDTHTQKILQRIQGFDALTLRIAYTAQKKYLLAGSARDEGLYAFQIGKQGLDDHPTKILDIPDPNEHIRKIRISAQNTLVLETIPFSYSLIARTAKRERTIYKAVWSRKSKTWRVKKRY